MLHPRSDVGVNDDDGGHTPPLLLLPFVPELGKPPMAVPMALPLPVPARDVRGDSDNSPSRAVGDDDEDDGADTWR